MKKLVQFSLIIVCLLAGRVLAQRLDGGVRTNGTSVFNQSWLQTAHTSFGNIAAIDNAPDKIVLALREGTVNTGGNAIGESNLLIWGPPSNAGSFNFVGWDSLLIAGPRVGVTVPAQIGLSINMVEGYDALSTGTVTEVDGLRVNPPTRSGGSVVVGTMMGLHIFDQNGIGATTYSIFTGNGPVHLGDRLEFGGTSAAVAQTVGTLRTVTASSMAYRNAAGNGDVPAFGWGADVTDRMTEYLVGGISAGATTAKHLEGSCTFSAATTCAVTFSAPNEADTAYDVFVETGANLGAVWITSKAVSGFTINVVTSNSGTVRWILIHQ